MSWSSKTQRFKMSLKNVEWRKGSGVWGGGGWWLGEDNEKRGGNSVSTTFIEIRSEHGNN